MTAEASAGDQWTSGRASGSERDLVGATPGQVVEAVLRCGLKHSTDLAQQGVQPTDPALV